MSEFLLELGVGFAYISKSR
ncbi:MAG: hypothetical protein AAF696_06630 [Bacteroidota bacterium]